jgi:hypothetical protein
MNADKHGYLINEPEKSFSSVFTCARKGICGEFLRFPVKNGRALKEKWLPAAQLFFRVGLLDADER